jgi:hypothetical protein
MLLINEMLRSNLMSKKLLVILFIIGLLSLSASAVYAGRGGNGGGNGGSNGGNGGNGSCTQDGTCQNYQTQQNNNSGSNCMQSGTCQNYQAQQNNMQGNMMGGNQAMQAQYGLNLNYLPAAVPGDVPDDVVAAMQAGLMDEYHAYAVYEAVMAQFGTYAPFTNIQRAELQHINTWTFMFERYSLDMPDAPVFDLPEFATLADACQAAADAEIANFDLYDNMLETFVNYPDLTQIATSLRNASEFSHLPAFEQCANR